MRLRFAVPALLLAATVAAAVPTVGSAAPKHNYGVTINVTPDPIITGEPVLIYGQLDSRHPAHRLVILFHRVNPSDRFVPVAATTTDAFGFYEFKRDDVVTNRSYYVMTAGGYRSRTVYERVAATLTINASNTNPDTNHTVLFTGHVDPVRFHVGQRVYLQAQQGPNGDDWRTLKSGTIDANSNYSIADRFLSAGERDLRVLFPGDDRNIEAASDVVTVTVQQAQNPAFTINAMPPSIDEGGSAVISGNLFTDSTAQHPEAGQTVALYGHEHGQAYQLVGQATTGAQGQYTFNVTPVYNEEYQVRTVPSTPITPVQKTAQLFEAVRDVVTISASSTTSTVGQMVTLSGTVSPSKLGHSIYLQRLGADGDWHTIVVGTVQVGSTYQFMWKFGNFGTQEFRTLVPGDAFNASGHSSPVTITVAPAPISALPPTP